MKASEHLNEDELIQAVTDEMDLPETVREHLRNCTECMKERALFDKELLTIQHIGKDTRVSGYVYDGTNGIDKDDVAALRDHGDKKYDVWVEDGYLRLWLSPVVVSGGAMVSDATFTAAILLALEAAGIVITAAISAGIVLIVAVVVGIAYILYANPDGSFDFWVEMSDIYTFADKYLNWWPYDFGIINSYAGLNRNNYIPIPYGPI